MNAIAGRAKAILALSIAATLTMAPRALYATDGHFLHGAGPVNEAMGGAEAGVCLDATGSIAWNPGCTVQFLGSRLEIHGTLFVPWRNLSSTVNANAFGPGIPGATLSGTTASKRDMSVMPGLAFVFRRGETVYHAGMLAVSGFGVNYAENTDFSNPILTPQAPNGFGFGRIRSNYMLVTIPVGMARSITERFSVGFSLVPSLSMLQVIPAPFSAPVTNGSTMPYYLSAGNNAPAFGGGVNLGAHYITGRVSWGASWRSPVWFRDFSWNRADLTGTRHTMTFNMNLPQVVTLGTGIALGKSTRIGVDGRWFNYAGTSGFDKVGYTAQGAVAGFGWRNIWAVGGGVQQAVAKSTRVMAGYNYSQNPVPNRYAFFNSPAPAIVQHHLSGGITQSFSKYDLTATYYHAFRNSITGPWISGQGPIPDTSVTSRMSENSLTIGVGRSF